MELTTTNTKVNHDVRPEAGVEGNDCVTVRLRQAMVTHPRIRLHREHRITHGHTQKESMRSGFR